MSPKRDVCLNFGLQRKSRIGFVAGAAFCVNYAENTKYHQKSRAVQHCVSIGTFNALLNSESGNILKTMDVS
jgi:hypothetical protein